MFKNRSHKKELLDEENIPLKDLERNLYELHIINQWLGGYRVSLNSIKKILKPGFVLADIGCGGGDTLKKISNQFPDKNLSFYGIDLKPGCINYCIQNKNNPALTFITDDYKNIFKHVPSVNILHAALFCHHLTEEEIIGLIRFARANKSILVINDLERNPIAYYAIKLLTALFSKSYLVKNDAPLSVLRGFTSKEWRAMIEKSGSTKFSVTNKWAFRHEIIIYE